VPRLVNTLCDTAMMAAFAANRDHVILEDINNSIEELQWVEYSVRAQLSMRSAPDVAHGATTHLPPGHYAPLSPSGTGSIALHMAPVDQAAAPAIGKLLVATEGRTVHELPLRPGRIIVGRTTDNDLQIDSRFVSRHHCQIVTTAHSCVIEDLNSTNGIYLQSRRVRRHYLNDGDVIVIGKHELIYVDDRAPRAKGSFTSTIPGTQDPDGADEEELPS